MRLFSFKGRAGRGEYLLHNMLDDLIMVVLVVIIMTVMEVFGDGIISAIVTVVGIVCIITVLILGIVSDTAVTVRRFHDLGRAGSDFWLLLIPVYNIFLGLTLVFQKGSEMENVYGPDPLVKIPVSKKTKETDAMQVKEQVRKFPDS